MEEASQGKREAQKEHSKLWELQRQRSPAWCGVKQVSNVQMPHVLMRIMSRWAWRLWDSQALQAVLIFRRFFLRKKIQAIRFQTILCRKCTCTGHICIEKTGQHTNIVSHWKVIVAWLKTVERMKRNSRVKWIRQADDLVALGERKCWGWCQISSMGNSGYNST